MKKGLIPIALGTIVTATGITLDLNQSKKFKCKRNDYTSLVGTACLLYTSDAADDSIRV